MVSSSTLSALLFLEVLQGGNSPASLISLRLALLVESFGEEYSLLWFSGELCSLLRVGDESINFLMKRLLVASKGGAPPLLVVFAFGGFDFGRLAWVFLFCVQPLNDDVGNNKIMGHFVNVEIEESAFFGSNLYSR